MDNKCQLYRYETIFIIVFFAFRKKFDIIVYNIWYDLHNGRLR